MSLTAAKTARSLMTATYYCTGVSGSRILGITDAYGTPTVPVVRPFYKPGATLYFPDDNLVFTVQAFAGGSALQTDQASPVYFGPSLPQTTNDSSARARGSGHARTVGDGRCAPCGGGVAASDERRACRRTHPCRRKRDAGSGRTPSLWPLCKARRGSLSRAHQLERRAAIASSPARPARGDDRGRNR